MTDLSIDKSPIIGIDLGTTNTCVSVVIDNRVKIIHNEHGETTTPSYVAFTDKERYVGKIAKELSIIDPANVVFDSKRIIGRQYLDAAVQIDRKRWPFLVYNKSSNPMIQVGRGRNKNFTPEAISAMILEKMKKIAEEYVGCEIKRAVITVPARFNILQRKATIDAGKIAGLEVMKLITEPTAAAIAYSLQENIKDKSHILVFDLGGGTFDVSILKIEDGKIEVLASDGDTHLGGEDFDNRLTDFIVNQFKNMHKKDPTDDKRAMRRLKAKCEQIKKTLSESNEALLIIDEFMDHIDLQLPITRNRFEFINKKLFEDTITTVKNTLDTLEFKKSDIDQVILIGGSTRIPKIQQLLQDLFDGKTLNKRLNPDEAVAYGAAVHAAQLNKDTNIESVKLQDVTPLSIGMPKHKGTMVWWINRNTPLPASFEKACYTIRDNQTRIKFQVYEGERIIHTENNLLGTFKLKNLPPALAGQIKVMVRFEVDENGILHIRASEDLSQNIKEIKITSNIGRLSESEVNRIIKQAEKYRQADREKTELNKIKSDLENLALNTLSRLTNPDSNTDLPIEEIRNILSKCKEVITWMDENNSNNIEDFEDKLVELENICINLPFTEI